MNKRKFAATYIIKSGLNAIFCLLKFKTFLELLDFQLCLWICKRESIVVSPRTCSWLITIGLNDAERRKGKISITIKKKRGKG